ncbi:MAG: NlpC/P60 family protein [Bacteroidota bacterium]|jgi:hypothetical protein
MKLNIIRILIISCCLSIFSCTKETKENTIFTNNILASGLNPEALSEEGLKFWEESPSVKVNPDLIELPNGYTLREFDSLYNLLGKSGDYSSQKKRVKLVADLSRAASEIINYSNFNNYAGAFSQTRLAYSWGSKNYQVRQNPPGEGAGCSSPIYGLDCSGFVWNVFTKAGINIINAGWASAENLRQINKIEAAIKKSNRDFENVKVIDKGKLDLAQAQTGDIIYWLNSNGVAEHIGIIVKEAGVFKVAQSNGGQTATCSQNYASTKGPRYTSNLANSILPSKSAGGPAPWGFGTEYGIVRIDETSPCNKQTVSGGLGVTRTPHKLGFDDGKVIIEYDMYPIPDQIDVYYKGVLVASSNTAVSGPGQVSFNYVYNKEDFVEVVMTGLISGTAWEYTVNCPQ